MAYPGRGKKRKRSSKWTQDIPLKEIPAEKVAEAHYSKLFAKTKKLVGNKTTFANDLNREAKKLFQHKFAGVFMSDRIPENLSTRTPYAIINLDDSTQPGSHWIAVAFRSPRALLVYDSYGHINRMPEMIRRLYPRSVTTDSDVEQGRSETNCGARTLAWLLMEYGFPKESPLI